jgi:hypothetical protein
MVRKRIEACEETIQHGECRACENSARLARKPLMWADAEVARTVQVGLERKLENWRKRN